MGLKLPELVRGTAAALGRPEPEVATRARYLREADLLPLGQHGGRPEDKPDVESIHAAVLVAGVLGAGQAKDVVRVVHYLLVAHARHIRWQDVDQYTAAGFFVDRNSEPNEDGYLSSVSAIAAIAIIINAGRHGGDFADRMAGVVNNVTVARTDLPYATISPEFPDENNRELTFLPDLDRIPPKVDAGIEFNPRWRNEAIISGSVSPLCLFKISALFSSVQAEDSAA